MNVEKAAAWMLAQISKETCLYQDDVVEYLITNKAEKYLRENGEGNLVVGLDLLKAFRNLTEATVVWVKPDRYWRFRVAEDEPGRDARG